MTIVRIDQMSLADVKKCQERFTNAVRGFDLPNSSRIYQDMRKWDAERIYSTISHVMRANDIVSAEIAKNQGSRMGMDLNYDVFLRAFRRQFTYTIECLSDRVAFLEVRERSRKAMRQLEMYPDSLIGGTDTNE